MEDLTERARRGETREFYRVPSQGTTATSRRIAEAVDNEEWQEFRHSLKGKSTQEKLDKLKEYYFDEYQHNTADVLIRVENYLKALARGGQIYPAGETMTYLERLLNGTIRIKS
jgi:hypothetical protein